MERRNHQICKLRCQTWTHVHIGCDKEADRWQYFLHGNSLYLLDYDELAKIATKQPALIDRMTDAAAKGGSNSLNEFLAREVTLRDQLAKASDRKGLKRVLGEDLVSAERQQKLTELRLFAGSPRCFIPGSSVKGALRTACISNQISAGKVLLAKDKRELQRTLATGFDLNSADNKIFQHIVVRDSQPLNSKDLSIGCVRIFASTPEHRVAPRQSVSGNRGPARRGLGNQDLFCEVLLCQTTFTLEMVLRIDKLQGSPYSTIEKLLSQTDQFYRRVWHTERSNREKTKHDAEVAGFYTEVVPPDDCYLLRLGFGSGQVATSVLMDYRQQFGTDKDLRQGPVYRNGQKQDRQPYPYTAKSALAGTDPDVQPLGWITINKDVEISYA